MQKVQLQELLNLPDPYADFVPNKDSIASGWNGNGPLFGDLVAKTKPKLIIEVGTWLGLSALNMASNLRHMGMTDSCVLCIDTWLGSAVHWQNPNYFKELKLKNGFPSFYYEFLSNVLNFDLQDLILPLPVPSSIAFRLLSAKNILADLIYIDGSHDYEDVSSDIQLYWQLLRPGGILFGDDWGFTDVKRSVVEFSEKIRLPFCISGPDKWAIQKPDGSPFFVHSLIPGKPLARSV